MNLFRTLAFVGIVSLVAACASSPKKEAPATPAPAPAMPAINLSGNWILTVESQMGSQDMKMSVNQAGSNLSGTMESPMGSVNYTGTLTGKDVKMGFNFNAQGTDLHIDYIGTTDGNTMSGKAVFGTFGEGTFKAKRQ